MYKVFINDHLLVIATEFYLDSKEVESVNFSSINLLELSNQLLNDSQSSRCIFLKTINLNTDWNQFQTQFKKVAAAGGKVMNDQNETLFIFRNGKWDLPKGKLEQGEQIEECAVREVMEECGIKDLTISEELSKTFHIYPENDALVLKTTHWFLMKTTYRDALVPQIEEGITSVIFKNEAAAKVALENTYGNIKLLF
jgi:8-oxo-dGTP pyrophosphatase MutT (NUDIX family)